MISRERWIGFLSVEGLRRKIIREILSNPEECGKRGITEFQRGVWNECCKIAYGHTARYGGIARNIGRPGASRAVGKALNSNPWPIIIPCHRVVPSDFPKSWGGFRYGIQRKRLLLEQELDTRFHWLKF